MAATSGATAAALKGLFMKDLLTAPWNPQMSRRPFLSMERVSLCYSTNISIQLVRLCLNGLAETWHVKEPIFVDGVRENLDVVVASTDACRELLDGVVLHLDGLVSHHDDVAQVLDGVDGVDGCRVTRTM